MGDTKISEYKDDDWFNVAMQFVDPSTINQNQNAIDQRHKAAELEKDLKRPDYAIPASATAALKSAEAQAKMKRLPGQSAIEGRLDAITADEIAMLERMGMGGPDVINAASRAYNRQQQKENELGVAAANMYLNNQQVLRNQQNQYANWELEQWLWDKKIPFEQKSQAIAALKGAAMQNTNTAFNASIGGIKDFFANYYSGGMAKSDSKKNTINTGEVSASNETTQFKVPKTSGNGIDNTNIAGGTEATITRTPEQKDLFSNLWGQ